MSTMTSHAVAVTGPAADREEWHDARSTRVTASRIHDIAVGGRATHLRILGDMLNGQTFQGNASTRRGHEREPFLIDFAAEFVVGAPIDPNQQLFVHPENPRIGATPDGLGDGFGTEVKSLDHGAVLEDVPADHYDQCQLGMYVFGYDKWLYGREAMGEDGEPTLELPWFTWIERDERRIAFLVREAERFLAWWDAGAPAVDDIAPELDDALAAWASARARKKDAEADEKAAEAVIREHIEKTPGAADDGLKLAGRAASFVYAVSQKDLLDTEAWAVAEPHLHGAWLSLQERVEAGAKHAAALYHKPARSTRLNITPTKDAA